MLSRPEASHVPTCSRCDQRAAAWVLPGRFYVCGRHRLSLGDWEWQWVVPLDRVHTIDLCPICQSAPISRNGRCEQCQWGLE